MPGMGATGARAVANLDLFQLRCPRCAFDALPRIWREQPSTSFSIAIRYFCQPAWLKPAWQLFQLCRGRPKIPDFARWVCGRDAYGGFDWEFRFRRKLLRGQFCEIRLPHETAVAALCAWGSRKPRRRAGLPSPALADTLNIPLKSANLSGRKSAQIAFAAFCEPFVLRCEGLDPYTGSHRMGGF